MFRLYVLVQGLSPEERNLFIDHCTNVKGHKSNSKYVQLFKLLIGAKEFNQKNILRKIGTTPGGLNSLSYYLQNILFESLANPLNGQRLGLSACRVAVNKGHFDYAEKTLSSEIEKGMEGEDLEYLYELYKYWEQVKQSYSVTFSLLSKLLEPFAFFRDYQAYISSEHYYRELAGLAGSTGAEKREALLKLGPMISSLVTHQSQFIRIQVAIKKLHFLLHRFDNNWPYAEKVQGIAFGLMNSNRSLFSTPDLLKEGNIRILMLINQEKDLLAKLVLEDICSIEVNEVLESYQTKIWIKNSMRLSLNLNDLKIGERTIKVFEKNLDLFSSEEKGLLFHMASLIHFSCEGWENAIAYQNKSSNALKRSKKLTSWSNFSIRAISYLELQEIGNAKRCIRHLKASIEDESLLYPSLLYELLASHGNSIKNGARDVSHLIDAKNKIQRVFSSEDERYASYYFNILSWIESKIQESDLQTILSAPISPKLMSIGLAS